MFYVNIRELLDMSLHFQDPQRFDRVVSDVAPDSKCLAGKRGEGITPDKIRQVLWLHKRLGHPSRGTMVKAIQNATWQGVPPDISASDVNATFAKTSCTACQLAKSNKLPRELGSGIHPEFPGQVISVDYQGMISPVSVRGFNGFYLFKCLMSGYRHAIMVTEKSGATFNKALAHVIDFYNLHGHVPRQSTSCSAIALELTQLL
jgi:hypothetical protein